MCKPSALVAHLWSDQSGSTAVEYATLAMVIAVALITVFFNLGTDIGNLWNSISVKVSAGG